MNLIMAHRRDAFKYTATKSSHILSIASKPSITMMPNYIDDLSLLGTTRLQERWYFYTTLQQHQ